MKVASLISMYLLRAFKNDITLDTTVKIAEESQQIELKFE